MCEILAIHGNNQGLYFPKDEIVRANDYNSDGFGYTIFEKKDKKWELLELDKFENFCGSYVTYYEGLENTFTKVKDNKNLDVIYKKQKELKVNQFMICHFRLATRGFTKNNIQPIVRGDYIVIHNGIMDFNGYSIGKNTSDSNFFAKMLDKRARRNKPKDYFEEKKLIDDLINEAKGSYSMFVYSKTTKNLYYIKNNMTSFYWHSENFLGSTRAERFPIVIREEVEDKILVV